VTDPLSAIGLESVDPRLEADLSDGLAAVEKLLRASVLSDHPVVAEAARHLVEAGGKRFRPLLVLLAAQFGDPQAAGVVPAAVVVELTHLATLYHDDVMDEAPLRRGEESANARWGNSIAILTGDLLFAKASQLLADLGPEAVRIQAETFEELVTGQIREAAGAGKSEPLVHYLQVVEEKTGSLVATSAQFGAMLSGASPEAVTALTDFGRRFGVAFQLADDLLDVASDTGESGKTPGTDLREGVATLPVLHALASIDPADARLRELLPGPLTDEAEVAEALQLLRANPAMTAARADLRHWADAAKLALEPLPDIPAKAALMAMADAAATRTA
jgi:heptaprenyl diphosphate synthase